MFQDHEIVQLQDFLQRRRVQCASYLDIIGQSPNGTTTTTGQIGEYVSATVALADAIALTNVTAANITSISLSAGDWDVWANAYFTGNAATLVQNLVASISSTSATADAANGRITRYPISAGGVAIFAAGDITLNVGQSRFSLDATTTVYLVVNQSFSVSTCSGYGIIHARRRRHYPG